MSKNSRNLKQLEIVSYILCFEAEKQVLIPTTIPSGKESDSRDLWRLFVIILVLQATNFEVIKFRRKPSQLSPRLGHLVKMYIVFEKYKGGLVGPLLHKGTM